MQYLKIELQFLNEYFYPFQHNMKMDYSKLGQFIKNERLKLGVSLNEFSFSNDIEPAILSRIENLKQDIKMNVLVKISSGFKKSPAQFLADFERFF